MLPPRLTCGTRNRSMRVRVRLVCYDAAPTPLDDATGFNVQSCRHRHGRTPTHKIGSINHHREAWRQALLAFGVAWYMW